MGKTHPQQAHQYPPGIKALQQVLGLPYEYVIKGCVGNALLYGMRIKVRIPDFNHHTGGQLIARTQFKGQLFGHPHQPLVELAQIGGIALKGLLRADGLAFVVALNGRRVDAVGLAPQVDAIFAQYPLHNIGGQLTQGFYFGHAHIPQQVKGLGSQHGNFTNGQRIEKGPYLLALYVQLPLGARLGLTGGNFRYGFVDRQTKGNGQTAFPHDFLPQLPRKLIGAKVAVHPR